MQCYQRPDDGVERRDRVTETEPHTGGWAIRLAGDEAQPARRLSDRAKGRLISHRSGLAVAGDPQYDQPLVRRHQLIGIEVPLLQPAGPEVLDQDVAFECQLANEGLVVRIVEIGRDRLLSPRLHEMPQRPVALPAHSPSSQRVALVRVFDLDDLRTEVGKYPAGEGPRDEGAQLEDSDVA